MKWHDARKEWHVGRYSTEGIFITNDNKIISGTIRSLDDVSRGLYEGVEFGDDGIESLNRVEIKWWSYLAEIEYPDKEEEPTRASYEYLKHSLRRIQDHISVECDQALTDFGNQHIVYTELQKLYIEVGRLWNIYEDKL
jgi:hypothetical protein